MSNKGCEDYDKSVNGFRRKHKARVRKGQAQNKIRYSPVLRDGQDSNVIGAIQAQKGMEILHDKRACADGVVWQLVLTKDAEHRKGEMVVGWTAEWQKGQGYYLEQVPRLD